MYRKGLIFCLLFVCILLFSFCPSGRKKGFEPAQKRTAVLSEWEDLRFGAFVHFNDNTCSVVEISKNTDPAIFNPVNLDFDKMMTTFQKAGVKYAVLTTRHTSGFCLWDSKMTKFDVASSPFRKDVVKLFVEACRKHRIKPCFYYCLWGNDRWNPKNWKSSASWIKTARSS